MERPGNGFWANDPAGSRLGRKGHILYSSISWRERRRQMHNTLTCGSTSGDLGRAESEFRLLYLPPPQ